MQIDLNVIGMIPVDSPENRAHYERLYCGDVLDTDPPMPQPYRDSVQRRCEMCRGMGWLAPKDRKLYESMSRTGTFHLVCFICAAHMSMCRNVSLDIHLPTSKRPGE